jgi:hypothetical protein
MGNDIGAYKEAAHPPSVARGGGAVKPTSGREAEASRDSGEHEGSWVSNVIDGVSAALQESETSQCALAEHHGACARGARGWAAACDVRGAALARLRVWGQVLMRRRVMAHRGPALMMPTRMRSRRSQSTSAWRGALGRTRLRAPSRRRLVAAGAAHPPTTTMWARRQFWTEWRPSRSGCRRF